MNILLGVTGSIAAKLTSRLEKTLYEEGHELKVVVTKNSEHFEGPSWIYPVYDDEDEWRQYKNNNTVLHIDLVKWADMFLIAPLTANTASKIKNKLADNLLTCCALAWNPEKPMIVAPAMNTQMWENLGQDRFFIGTDMKVVMPQEKTLYCGDTGLGAMAEISDIVRVVNCFKV